MEQGRPITLHQRPQCGLRRRSNPALFLYRSFASASAVRIASTRFLRGNGIVVLCLSVRSADCVDDRQPQRDLAGALPQRPQCGLRRRVCVVIADSDVLCLSVRCADCVPRPSDAVFNLSLCLSVRCADCVLAPPPRIYRRRVLCLSVRCADCVCWQRLSRSTGACFASASAVRIASAKLHKRRRNMLYITL